ncbi:MAG: DUF1501 domain-containing protein [Fimbriimonas sp.]
MSDLLSRRDVIRGGSIIAIGMVAPRWLSSVAHADLLTQAKGGKTGDTVLVVIQLSGGNDGLNMVVPYTTKRYYELRPTIGLTEDKVLKINNDIGFHPSMTGLAELYQQKKVAVIQNVGYPNPNRSHFKSMDIWQSASPESKLKYGWIGRHFDAVAAQGAMNPVIALGLSTEKPLALSGKTASVPCFASLSDIQNMIGDPDTEKLLRQIQGADAPTGSAERAVQNASRTALDAMGILSKQLKNYDPKQKYGEDDFGRGFKQIAQLIATSPATRVVYFSAGGFDTHAKQADAHGKLMGGLSSALNAFQKEMEAVGKADKVVVLVFSEFGRRVAENASQGTDHGAAAPMLLVGSKVKGGVYGPLPDLMNLDDGDLKHAIDFREVYAATLDNWIGGDSGVVLGQQFKPLEVIQR